jgi:hypothetical protein
LKRSKNTFIGVLKCAKMAKDYSREGDAKE